MTFAAGIEAMTQGAEAALVAGLALERVSVPRELARLEGSFRDAPVALDARAYRGPRTAYARIVRVRGRSLDIANVLCLSAPEYALPILGVDLVSVAHDTLVAVADLSPVAAEAAARSRALAPLERRLAEGPLGLERGEIPSWCSAWFSPLALVTRTAAPGVPLVAAAVERYVAAHVELAGEAAPELGSVAHVSRAQRDYSLAHIEHDRGLGLLRKLFDPELAERFLREVLFPERMPPWP